MNLRPRQHKFVADLGAAYRQGHHAVLGCAPCGFGKTVVMAHMCRALVASGQRVLIACHREELLYQTSEKMTAYGVPHGMHSGNNNHGAHHPVQIATIQTALNRQFRHSWMKFDEAHLSKAESWLKLRARYMSARLLGLSASPTRLDGKGFGDMYGKLVMGPTTLELIDDGSLVAPRCFAPSVPDLSGVDTVAGDYNQGQLADVMQGKRLVGDIVQHWKRIASDRLTLLFAVNRQHSKLMAEEFSKAGVTAEHIDGTTAKAERRAILGRFGKTTQVLCSVLLFTEGFDRPEISAIIDAAPTQSFARHRQKLGRGGRTAPGKTDYIILDHAGNIAVRHGFPHSDVEWSLDSKKQKKNKNTYLPAQILPRVCPECFTVLPHLVTLCPCGYKFSSTIDKLKPAEGELVEIKTIYRPEEYGNSNDPAVQAIITKAQARNYKPGYVHVMSQKLEEARAEYRTLTGSEPKLNWNEATLNAMVGMSK